MNLSKLVMVMNLNAFLGTVTSLMNKNYVLGIVTKYLINAKYFLTVTYS